MNEVLPDMEKKGKEMIEDNEMIDIAAYLQ